VYPAAGVLLSFGAPVGLVIVRGVLDRVWPGPAWAMRELSAHPEIYAYVALSTMLVFVLLGIFLGRREDRLETWSTTDALTGLCNRRLFDTRLREELRRASRYRTPLSLAIIDVDKLKDINDQHGHGAGDEALRTVARCLRDSCRINDLAARYGGDEFAILAPGTDAAGGLELASRLRAALDDARRIRVRDAIIPTISIGIGEFDPTDRGTPERLGAAADQALYAAKSLGRNCAVSIPPGPPSPWVARAGGSRTEAPSGRRDKSRAASGK